MANVVHNPNTLGRIFGYVTSSIAYARQQLGGEAEKRRVMIDLLGKMSGTGYGRLVDSSDAELLAITSYAVFTAVRLIGGRIAARKAWPQAMVREGETLAAVNNHEFEQLLRWPNDLMSYGFIAKYCTGWYLLRGSSYIFISTPKMGVGPPTELWPLPANLVTPRPETLRRSTLTDTIVIDYYMTVEGRKYPLNGENMMRVNFPNWWDYWNGLSSLTGSMSAVRTDIKQAKWEEDFYGEDNAVPTAILSLPQDMSDTDFQVAKEAIKEQFGKNRSSAITRGGDLTVEVIQQTLEEMQIRLSREFNRDQIYQVMGVPKGLVTGDLDADNVYATLMSFALNTVQPILDEFAAQWTIALRPYYGDAFEAVAADTVPQDRALAVQEYTIYSQDKTVNENRAEQGYAPLDLELADRLPVRMLRLYRFGGHPTGDGQVGTLLGSESPAQLEGRLTDDGTDTDDVPKNPEDQGEHGEEAAKALAAAMRTELRAWRKVALGQLKKGRDPLAREFVTAVIPGGVAEETRLRLAEAGQDIGAVKAVFTEIGKLFGMQATPQETDKIEENDK